LSGRACEAIYKPSIQDGRQREKSAKGVLINEPNRRLIGKEFAAKTKLIKWTKKWFAIELKMRTKSAADMMKGEKICQKYKPHLFERDSDREREREREREVKGLEEEEEKIVAHTIRR
jgi:hypothetical protein